MLFHFTICSEGVNKTVNVGGNVACGMKTWLSGTKLNVHMPKPTLFMNSEIFMNNEYE